MSRQVRSGRYKFSGSQCLGFLGPHLSRSSSQRRRPQRAPVRNGEDLWKSRPGRSGFSTSCFIALVSCRPIRLRLCVYMQGKGTGSFGKRRNKTHTICPRCGRRSYHLQKGVCSSCGYPSARIRKCK